ncbi:UNVERIFIED_CONTAM: hypothetical protein Sindi_0374500 [Sesamum indicum]
MAKLYVTLVLVLIVVVHATARNIPTDQTKPSSDHTTAHEATNPNTNALAPVQNTENVAATATAPVANGGLNDQKNFITYGGVGGWGGVGGYVGVLPIFGLGGLGGAGGLGGLGGVGGLGAGGGIGKVGGIGVGGGVGGILP